MQGQKSHDHLNRCKKKLLMNHAFMIVRTQTRQIHIYTSRRTLKRQGTAGMYLSMAIYNKSVVNIIVSGETKPFPVKSGTSWGVHVLKSYYST